MKYVDADLLRKEIEFAKLVYSNPERVVHGVADAYRQDGRAAMCDDILNKLDSLQQEQPIEGKQVIIITETDGDANIHWDCRSLDDVMALLTSAKSFIADKQIEELRGQGSGPDHNTVEGRFRNAHKFQQEQPDVELEREMDEYYDSPLWEGEDVSWMTYTRIAHHFYELGQRVHSKISNNSFKELRKEVIKFNQEHFDELHSDMDTIDIVHIVAVHFYELGLNARKEEKK